MAERPVPQRVVWITTDHLRYDSVAALGHPWMHTPALDALVRGGVSFDRCYVQSPLCMPSRCSFMTGLYPPQTGVTRNGIDLPPGFEPTVATAFRAAGYRTAQIGKLHFQSHEDHDLDPRARHAYGFDVLWLAEEPGCYDDAYLRWLRSEHPGLVETFRLPRPNSAGRAEADRRGRVLDAPWEASFSGWIAQQAERYLLSWAGRGDPQFVHLGFYAPHPPLNPTREMAAPYEGRAFPPPPRRAGEEADKPPPIAALYGARGAEPAVLEEYRRLFAAMVTGVDLAVGRLVGALRARGWLDDTLIVFTSDHGDLCGDHGLLSKNTSYYEGIVRVPWLLHWPRGLGAAAGLRVDGLAEMVDLLPTLLGLCGARPPAAMAGRNLAADLLAGRAPAGREDVFAYHEPGDAMLRTATHKYLRYVREGRAAEALYDLRDDPHEFVNRAADPACAAARAELRDRCLTRALAACRSARPAVYRF